MSEADFQGFPERQHIDVDHSTDPNEHPEIGRTVDNKLAERLLEIQGRKANPSTDGDERTEAEKKADNKLAERLSVLIEDANSRVVPLCRMIRKVR
jgi:type I site-specific restriction-modification system R (restriction) subunit